MKKTSKRLTQLFITMLFMFLVVNISQVSLSFIIPEPSTTYQGYVKDNYGDILVSAKVQLYEDTVCKRTVYTDSNGWYTFTYTFQRLKIYFIKVSKSGYSTEQAGAIGGNIRIGYTISRDWILQDLTPPPAPKLVVNYGLESYCRQYDKTSVEVVWEQSSDPHIGEYRVFCDGTRVGTVDSTILNYIVTGLEPYSTHSFQVSAVDESGNVGAKSTSTTIRMGIQWWIYVDENGQVVEKPEDPALWNDLYWQWLEENQFVFEKEGFFDGNRMVVSLLPQYYNGQDILGQFRYILNVRAESGVGGDPDSDVPYYPQPTVDDHYSSQDIPVPMAIDDVQIKTTILPETDGTSTLSDDNNLEFFEATTNSFLGDYYGNYYDLSTMIYNGDFEHLGSGWAPVKTHNDDVIQYENSIYTRYDGYYAQIYHSYSSQPTYIYSNPINIDNNQFKISYYGKRTTSYPNSPAGIEIVVHFTNTSPITLTPDELKMESDSSYWKNYQFSYEAPNFHLITYIEIRCYNNIYRSSVFFDEIYVSQGLWELEKEGDWVEGTFEDNYDTWLTEMEDAQAWNDMIGDIGTAISLLGKLVGGKFSKVTKVGGFLLNSLLRDYINPYDYYCRGTEPGKASTTILFDYHNGQNYINDYNELDNGYVLACDNTLGAYYVMNKAEFVNHCLVFNIEVRVSYRLIGTTNNPMFVPSGNIETETISFNFDIPISLSKWNP